MADDIRSSPDTATVRKKSRPRRSSKRGIVAKLTAVLAESFPKLTALLKIAREWTRRKPLWVRAPLYLLLVLGAIGYTFGDSLANLPVVKAIRGKVTYYVEDIFAVPLPVASGREFTIAVAKIEDDDGSVGRSLALALRISGVERLQIDRRLRFADAANLDAAEEAAHQTARRWLEKTKADLLFWGQTIPGEPRGVRLIMSVRNADSRYEAEVGQSHLAFNFVEETREPFEAAVQAQVLGHLAKFDPSHAVAEQLRHAIARLRGIVQGRKEGPGRGALIFALANSRALLGEQAGDAAVLAEAVATYQELLKDHNREAAPLDWAIFQNNLGSALCSLGKLEREPDRLKQAVDAYRLALDESTDEKMPQVWAERQNSLGHALETLGRRETGTARVEEAIRAYRAALTKLPSGSVDRAMVQNNLGNALVFLGEQESGTARLDEAVALFREALIVRTRKEMPLRWATSQNNLGNALTALGEREKGTTRLEEAVAAYREALKEYKVEKVPLDWAMVQSNLGTALGVLGEREKGTARLNEAVDALRAALEKREKLTLSWARTQRNLGNIFRLLGERENDPRHFANALAAYRAALQAYTQKVTPFDWAMTHNDLGDTLRVMAEREKSLRLAEEAVQMLDAAKSVPELKSKPADRAMVQENFWKADALRQTLAAAPGVVK